MINQIRKQSQSNHSVHHYNYPQQFSAQSEEQSRLLMQDYQLELRCYSQAPQNIISCILEEDFVLHRISYVNVEKSLLIKDENKLTRSDCAFFVTKTQFNGLQYIYQVLIGPFLLKILVLNLNRNSDDNDEQIQKQQIGSGGFGTVRVVRIDNENYAVKRIPFQYKLDSGFSYDIQAECNQQYQLRRCLRQFCIFKICSLLGIGPRLCQEGYDLICFNNCIEFRMELCEPVTSHQFSLNRDSVGMNTVYQNLLRKMALLHDLKIVHRDIKPQNILYSPFSKGLVFGDFGMSLIIKQNINEETLTNFAGTPNFASPNMKALMNGNKGNVNLYLNDFYGLKETIKSMEVIYNKQNSQISRNNMSYSGDFVASNNSKSQDFDFQQISNGSLRQQTDISYTSTGHSLINFTSASTQAPKQQASAFNHYQSELIYYLCRLKEKRRPVNMSIVQQYFFTNLACIENLKIDALKIDIIELFNLQESKKTQVLSLRQWKAASRHFGPKNQRTQMILDDIIKFANSELQLVELRGQLLAIRSKLLGTYFKTEQIQLRLARTLGNFQNYEIFLYEFLKGRNQQLDSSTSSNNPTKQKQSLQEMDTIASQFLYYDKNSQVSKRYFLKIKRQLLLYYNRLYQIDVNRMEKGNLCLQICFKHLIQRKKITLTDFYCYIKAKRKTEIIWNKQQMGKYLKQVLTILPPLTIHDHLVKSMFYLQLSVQFPELKQIIFENSRKNLASLCENHPQGILIQASILILHNQFGQYETVLGQVQKLKTQLLKNKNNFINWQYYHAFLSKIFADALIRLNRPQAYYYYMIALQQMHCAPGRVRAKQLFEIYNNIAYLRVLSNDLIGAKKSFTEIREILEKQDFQDTNYNLIYVYQQLMRIQAFEGIKSQQQIRYSKDLISLITKRIRIDVPIELQSLSVCIAWIQSVQIEPQTRLFIAKQIVRNLKNTDYNKQILAFTHLKVAQILCSELRRYYQGQKYLWNFIELRQKISFQLTQKMVRIFNYFTSLLIKSNSYRRAIIFIKSYIFRIPISMLEVKKKAIRLIYSAYSQISDKRYRLYSELMRNDFQILMTKRIDSFMIKERNPYRRNIYKKWLSKI